MNTELISTYFLLWTVSCPHLGWSYQVDHQHPQRHEKGQDDHQQMSDIQWMERSMAAKDEMIVDMKSQMETLMESMKTLKAELQSVMTEKEQEMCELKDQLKSLTEKTDRQLKEMADQVSNVM